MILLNVCQNKTMKITKIKFDCAESVKRYNDLARESMICRLLQDIRVDLAICDIEGWNKLEYINRLKAEINSLGAKTARSYERKKVE